MFLDTSFKDSWLKTFFNSIKVGFFLAVRDLRRSNKWTTGLIIFIMTLTFLNLIVVRGLLVGLIEGSINANRVHYSGNILLTPLKEKNYIEKSQDIIKVLQSIPSIKAYSARYTVSGKVETGYKTKIRTSDASDSANGLIEGIDPANEDKTTGLSSLIVEGKYLEPGDTDQILIGASLLFKYSPIESSSLSTLRNAEVGSKVRLTVNGLQREVTIKGIIKGKVTNVDSRIYMLDNVVRQMSDRDDFNVDEIAVLLDSKQPAVVIKQYLIANGYDKYARIRTDAESLPSAVIDIRNTFSILGNAIGTIGLIVASITIFIVIFVNAITRRKYIGILKGIGINSFAIEVSYIFQSLFYAVAGIGVAIIVIFFFLKPYFDQNPINFPFSDGILVASVGDVLTRASLLMIATLCAGYVPARIVVNQNTLDAILGR